MSPSAGEGCRASDLYLEGAARWNQGRRDEAIRLLDAALREDPHHPDALCMGGYILGLDGKREAALAFYRRALEVRPHFAVAWSNTGKLLFELGRWQESLQAFERALEFDPGDARAWSDQAGALRHLGRLLDSLAAADRAIALRRDFAEAHLNRGIALLKLDRAEEALAAYRSAEACRSPYADAVCGAALALRALDRLAEAEAEFDRAIALGSYDAISGKGCLRLTAGDFATGWEGYEARWIGGKTLAEALGAGLPLWNGEMTAGLRLLVINDHGLGDTIQFFRYLPLLAEACVDVTFLAPAKMRRLLAQYHDIRVVDHVEDGVFDAQIALSSLPRAFRTRLDSIPATVPYLRAEPELCRIWQDRLGAEGFKIGLVWSGNPNPEADSARSIPLAEFAPLAAIPGARLVSLQKGSGIEQLGKTPPGMRIEVPGEGFDESGDAFVDTAAIMANLDLIVTCDTSIAHLAGALGRPVWVALKTDSEWRWLRDRDDSPWYPTMRLFRQKHRGAWSDVASAMAAAAAERAKPAISIETPISVGELLDKITILEIKSKAISDPEKRRNVEKELVALRNVASRERLDGPDLTDVRQELAQVNACLWKTEDDIRSCEGRGDFGESFVSLARSVYRLNDRRAALKKQINLACNSALVEEKSYAHERQEGKPQPFTA